MRSFHRQRHGLLAVYTLSYFATRIEPLAVAPLVPEITTSLETTSGAVGTAMTGLWAAYAIAQLPSGILADRYGRRRLILFVLVCGALGSVLLAAAPSILIFAVVVVLLGGSLGLYYNVGVLSLDDQFEGTGWALGIHRIGSQAAGLVVPIVAATIGAWYSWRIGLLLGAAVALPVAGLAAVFMEPTRPTEPTAPATGLLDQLRSGVGYLRRIGSITTVAGIGEFVALANITFLPTFLIRHHGFDSVLAGAVFSLYFLIVSATHPIAGWCSDRFRPIVVVGAALAIGVISHSFLVVAPTRPAVIVGAGTAALTMGFNVPLQSKLLAASDQGDRAESFGVFRTAYILLGSLGGTVTGTIADTAGWGLAYAFVSAILLVGLALLLVSRDSSRLGGHDAIDSSF
ncbi:MFS transporter [Halobellus marinus]|uniref:MFS transporter n=1 Tax=Halobellus TaxID=1073986 RepID=UPI0028A7322E|nr:MFS transporter [Halobellus sp. DFY28]